MSVDADRAIALIADNLDACHAADVPGLRKRLRALREARRAGQDTSAPLAELIAHAERSLAKVEARRARLPTPEYPPELPVAARREDIMAAIAAHQVVILCGETGSGKTTQLPKMLLEMGRGTRGLIGHTQPRRIAARSTAARIAQELGTPLGELIGYKVRFSDHSSDETLVRLMTDGILLAEIPSDRSLSRYDTLIIDEAHERSLNIDFLLGYLKRLLPRRPDLKLIITSATLDPERFSRHFDNAPILNVEGRGYPVEIRYRPLLSQDEDGRDRDLIGAVLDAVDELAHEGPGDVLVFFPGEREIREAAEALRKHHPPHTEILPLYARLSAEEQNRVFAAHPGRRIVLATNVAETSLTVPGIHYVVDTGTARVARYSSRSRMQRLLVEPISQAAANQRAGRCGRVAPGICIRLYGEDDFAARAPFTDPEILRANLASVILRLEDLRLGHPEDFPFVEPPEARQIGDAWQLLFELGAVDASRQLTETGQRLARLPLDPRLGRMLLAAEREGVLEDVLVIASFLAIQDPRERPMERQQAADQAHARWSDETSDFLAVLKLWDWVDEQYRHLSQNKWRQQCPKEFLSYVRLREWRELHAQLRAAMQEGGTRLDAARDPARRNADAIHRALLSALLSHIGLRDDEGRKKDAAKGGKSAPVRYLGARNRRFQLFPGSFVSKQPPRWVMSAEIVETARVFARMNAAINPRWIEALAAHLVTRSYSEPHWERERQQVGAFEHVSLYGLPIVPRRRINFGPVDPLAAREIFIRKALVEGEYDSRAPFFLHNQALIDEIHALEAKSRRPDILVDADTLYDFYHARLPAGIYSGAQFDKWRREAEAREPRLLFLEREMLMRHAASDISERRFPPFLEFDGLRLPLSYHFEPGSEADGVTLTVPLAALNQIDAVRGDYLVPGLLEEKITELIRALPKALRRHFVPAPDYARAVFERLGSATNLPLCEAIGQALRAMSGVEVPREDWSEAELPTHLRLRYVLVDAEGQVRASGRDLAALRAALGEEASSDFTDTAAGFEREGLNDWDFGELPETVAFDMAGVQFTGYPALIDEGDSVALRVMDSPEAAGRATRLGLARLLLLRLRPEVKTLERQLPGIQTLCLHYSQVRAQPAAALCPRLPAHWPHTACEQLKMQLILAAAARTAIDGQPPVREAAAFNQRVALLRSALPEALDRLCREVAEVLSLHHELRTRLKGRLPLSWIEAAADMAEQCDALIYKGFVVYTPPERLGDIARYMKAAHKRLEKLDRAPDRDRLLRVQYSPLWMRYRALAARSEIDPAALDALRWRLEELRIALFAQEIGTRESVSVTKLEKEMAVMGAA